MASYFEWNPATYGINVPEMDEEHRVLIGLMNRLHELGEAQASKAQMSAALDALVSYTQRHFAREEVYMEKIGYPGVRTHKVIHKDLLAKVGAHVATFNATGTLGADFYMFLKVWLKSHICGIDTKYAKHAAAA